MERLPSGPHLLTVRWVDDRWPTRNFVLPSQKLAIDHALSCVRGGVWLLKTSAPLPYANSMPLAPGESVRVAWVPPAYVWRVDIYNIRAQRGLPPVYCWEYGAATFDPSSTAALSAGLPLPGQPITGAEQWPAVEVETYDPELVKTPIVTAGGGA